MIKKILSISNVGHFVNYAFKGSKEWNGEFHKINIIYAENASGKTTIATILKSLARKDQKLLNFKRTFSSANNSNIKIVSEDKIITYDENGWDDTLNIEVYDINYIEDYLFVGSVTKKQNKDNLYLLLLGQKGKELKVQLKGLMKEKQKYTNCKKINLTLEQKMYIEELDLNFTKTKKEFDDYANPIFKRHIESMNKYLAKFTSYIKIVDITSEPGPTGYDIYHIYPVYEVYGERIKFLWPSANDNAYNARYSLSEGDKSTIALCFFLARLDINSFYDKIIVFDDPLSSFDYSRRNVTIFLLAKIAEQSKQFILLTHDLNFANDFTRKCSFMDTINLKIEKRNDTSGLYYHDISSELLTGLQKDIQTIKDYLKNNNINDFEKREVIRCIRPILEGAIKIKYFDIIENNSWLGDIIKLIRNSNATSRLYRLNGILCDIIELNDYTKDYHHAPSNSSYENINSIELKRYINLLIETIDKI
jgi:wobble nucleotide-excising tRNase